MQSLFSQQESGVDERREHRPDDGSHPVDGLVREKARGESGSQGPGGIHRGAGDGAAGFWYATITGIAVCAGLIALRVRVLLRGLPGEEHASSSSSRA